MSTTVVIAGDLLSRPDRTVVLEQLAEKAPSINWEWIQANNAAFNLPRKPFNQLRARLTDENKRSGPLLVVKLDCLNGKDANALFQVCLDPILAPQDLIEPDELVAWLLSEEARIVDRDVWTAPVRQAALLALLSKLIRNKSWNNSVAGHAWTQEADLLHQRPVYRDDHRLYGHAMDLLRAPLFLTKGASQGKTKKEWSIKHKYLRVVKQAICGQSLDPLRDHPDLADFMVAVDAGPADESVLVDDEIVTERVRDICRNIR